MSIASRPAGLTCLHCTAQTDGIVLCQRCQQTTAKACENIAGYHADLFSLPSRATGIRRAHRVVDPTGNAVGMASGDSTVEDIAAATRNLLATWVRVLLDDRPQLRAPADNVPAMAKLLAQQIRSIATLDWCAEMLRQLLDLEHRLRRIIARHRGQWYAGICSAQGNELEERCQRDLYAQPGEAYVRCPGCGTRHLVSGRRKVLLDEAYETLLPVSVIARAAVTLLDGEPSVQRLEARLRQWVHRGDLQDHGTRTSEAWGNRARRVYRLGDVIDTLTRDLGGLSA